MSTYYEWCIEYLENGEIVDLDHYDTFAELVHTLNNADAPAAICLVRDVWDGDNLRSRTWAYVTPERTMEPVFSYVLSEKTHPVPRRFRNEFADHIASLRNNPEQPIVSLIRGLCEYLG